MKETEHYINLILKSNIIKIIISNPVNKSEPYKKIVIEQKADLYRISKYTEKQVFHDNVTAAELGKKVLEAVDGHFKQLNAWSEQEEHILLISKKGACNYKVKKNASPSVVKTESSHNRKKNYILSEGFAIPPLVDMGVFTPDGRIVNAMYHKFKQINRFLEIIDDELSKTPRETLNVIDFGCGKSYLTFVLYYYLTSVKNIKVNMIGLDLKADVIQKCNESAKKYNYSGLKFELGDINGYTAPFEVDMVITLHACDTATDFALCNAVNWNAKYIFSVPCCQHELNGQMSPKSLTILSRYGIIQERFAALATDAIRANLLEYCGYKTQLLEFIDLDHTPKNILIRASKRPSTSNHTRQKALDEVKQLIEEFGFNPTLYNLLISDEQSKLP